ncbi:4-hydroxy-tetrahydrodipicolinate synthase [soil metagenome]
MNRREALMTIGVGTAASVLARPLGLVAAEQAPAPVAGRMTRDTARAHFGGISLFAMTPMRAAGGKAEVDYDGFARNMRFYAGHKGTYTLAVCGAVGEYFALTPEERQRLFTIAVAEKSGHLLVAGASGDTTREAIANAQAAEKAGADVALVLPSEAIGKSGDAAMRAHFLEIARAVGIGVIPYRSPVTLFSLDTVEALLNQPNILAVKEQTGDLRFIRDAVVRTKKQIPLIPAHERMAPFNYLAGASGITSGHANFTPSRTIELWEWLGAGRTEEAMALADKFAELDRLRATYGDVLLKVGLELRGLAGGPLRLKPAPLPAEGRKALERVMRELGVLERLSS